MTRLRLLLSLLFALLTAGCLGDPDIDGAAVPLSLEPEVEAAAWQAAPAGCEDVRPLGLRLAGCVGAPALGALVDARGRVQCVDALGTFELNPLVTAPITPQAGDPSPQPNRPPPPQLADRRIPE